MTRSGPQFTNVLLLAALLLLAAGLGRGEADQIWIRAIEICLECVGLR